MNILKLIKSLLATGVFAASTALAASHTISTDASIDWSNVEIQSTYSLNTNFIVPSRSALVNDVPANVSHYVVFPSGKTSKFENVKLTESGEYSLMYKASFNEYVFTKEEKFIVQYGIVSFTSSNSSYSYGKHEFCTKQEGLLVKLSENDTLYFNNLINVNELTSSTNLLTLFATPDVQGVTEFSHFNIKLEDANNAEKYFILNIKQTPENDTDPISYLKARGENQPLTGLLDDNTPTTTTWGKRVYHSFSGTYFGNPAQYDSYWNYLKVNYDNNSKAVLIGNGNNVFQPVIDLDNPDHFASVWTGFTSDKVRLSITCDQYHSKYASFCISNAFGVDLTADHFDDNEPPIISVESEYETMPKAVKGEYYPVPKATANDVLSGDCEVFTNAYYNYTSTNPTSVPINDGKFLTDRCGSYAIVYTSRDDIGNIAKKELTFVCVEKHQLPQLNLVVDFDTTSSKAGEKININRDVILTGGSGNLSLRIYAVKDNTKIDIKGSYFIPEETGNWEIVFEGSDYVGQKVTQIFHVSVFSSSDLTFNNSIVLPKIMISESAYTLPKVQASDYSSGTKKLVDATAVKVKDKDGEHLYSPGQRFVPSIENNGDLIEVSYICNGYLSETFSIPVVKVWDKPDGAARKQLNLKNYFYGEGFDIELLENRSLFKATDDGENSWLFANTLIANNFSIVLNSDINNQNFDGLNIVLTDSENEDISFSFDILKNGLSSYTSFDNFSTIFDFGFKESSKTNSLAFSFDGKTVTINTKYKFDVNKTTLGTVFEGFPSGKVYLNVGMINAAANKAGYYVENIGGQVIFDTTIDRNKPMLVPVSEYVCSASIDEVVSILPAFIAGDVLDPNVSSVLSVYSPNGELAKDINGNILENVDIYQTYQIKIEQYGQYSIKYVVSDVFNARGNVLEYQYAINVDDAVDPFIHFSCQFQDKVKVGESIIIPDITVTDNLTKSEDILVIRRIINPNGVSTNLPKTSNSYKTTIEGVYEIVIIAIDGAGNSTYFCHQVAATK